MPMVPKSFTGTAAATTQVITGACEFGGYSIREAAGTPAAALVEIFDNTAASGTLIATIPIASSGGTGGVVFNPPLHVTNGVMVKVTAGTVSGSVYLD